MKLKDVSNETKLEIQTQLQREDFFDFVKNFDVERILEQDEQVKVKWAINKLKEFEKLINKEILSKNIKI